MCSGRKHGKQCASQKISESHSWTTHEPSWTTHEPLMNHHQPSSTIINHHEPPWTIINHFFSGIILQVPSPTPPPHHSLPWCPGRSANLQRCGEPMFRCTWMACFHGPWGETGPTPPEAPERRCGLKDDGPTWWYRLFDYEKHGVSRDNIRYLVWKIKQFCWICFIIFSFSTWW